MTTPRSARLPRWAGLAATAALLAACRSEASRELPTPLPPTAAPTPSATASAEAAPAPAPAGSATAASTAARYAFDFEDAGLPELVKRISAITGRRFVWTGKLPDIHATVYSPEPVTAEDAYRAFLSILQANGLTVIERGSFSTIVASPGMAPVQ
jgi:general secretion pathway protein D